jgi:hypothetical protein
MPARLPEDGSPLELMAHRHGPCDVCADGNCSGLHDGDARADGSASAWCRCIGCEEERGRQGVEGMYSLQVWLERRRLGFRRISNDANGPG